MPIFHIYQNKANTRIPVSVCRKSKVAFLKSV